MSQHTSRSKHGRAPHAPEPKSTTRVALAVGGGLVALLAVLLLRSPGSEELPPELYGRWTTTNDRYEGRGFSLDESSLAIYTSPTDSTVHPIRRVKRDDADGLLTYSIEYDEQGTALQFAIAYGDRAPSGAPMWVHFPHQPEIEWRKASR